MDNDDAGKIVFNGADLRYLFSNGFMEVFREITEDLVLEHTTGFWTLKINMLSEKYRDVSISSLKCSNEICFNQCNEATRILLSFCVVVRDLFDNIIKGTEDVDVLNRLVPIRVSLAEDIPAVAMKVHLY